MSEIWNKSSVKKGWLKPETQRIWHQHVKVRAKLKSHSYTILLRSHHTCPQIQHNYIWSLDPQDIQGCLSQNVMRDGPCKTKVYQSPVYPRGAASLIFCSPNISCAANLCALQWKDKFLIQPSTGGGVPNTTLKLYFLTWSSVWSLISSQIVDLELSIWIPALPPSVALKYWVTINPGQRTNPNSSFYSSPSSTLALDAA